MENRRTGPEPDIEVWKMAHKWTVQAFLEPSHPPDKARLSKILRKPIPNEISELLLDFDKYSQAITSMSLSAFFFLNRTNSKFK